MEKRDASFVLTAFVWPYTRMRTNGDDGESSRVGKYGREKNPDFQQYQKQLYEGVCYIAGGFLAG